MDDGSLDDNVESFLSHDDPEPRDRVGRCADVSKGTIIVDFLIIGGMCCHTKTPENSYNEIDTWGFTNIMI